MKSIDERTLPKQRLFALEVIQQHDSFALARIAIEARCGERTHDERTEGDHVPQAARKVVKLDPTFFRITKHRLETHRIDAQKCITVRFEQLGQRAS